MKKLPFVFHPDYSPDFDPKHRFPMEKFQRLYERIEKLGLFDMAELFSPTPADPNTVALAHDPQYVRDFSQNRLSAKAMRRIGLPWSAAVRDRTFLAVGGSLLCTELALQRGLAVHLAGGTHHAHFSEGSGFCIFNDLAICALHALKNRSVSSVMIIDADVHQGDGTARILENRPDAITVSIHCKQNFPARKAISDHDIEINHGAGDAEYLDILKQNIPYLLEIHQPEFVIYDAGADTHKDDSLGLLELTDEGMFERDIFVLSECAERNIPVSCVIGGGYMKDRVRLSEVHSIIHQAAFKVWQTYYQFG